MAISTIVLVLCFGLVYNAGATVPFYGEKVGSLSTLSHRVSGDVYIVDEKRIRIKNFVYDGTGPAAYFWGGQRGESGPTPDSSGAVIPDENGGRSRLRRYDNADIVMTLPSPLTAFNVVWLSVWCEEFAVDFGNVLFAATVRVPRPTFVGTFSEETKRISSGNVTVTDANTILVKSFTCGSCLQSDAQIVGSFLQAIVVLQQSSGRSENLDRASGVRVNLTVPDPTDVTKFAFIAVHSFDSNQTLARISLPSSLLVPPDLSGSTTTYHGVHIGRLPTLAHRVTGDVYVIDSKHFLIKNFVYDGTAPTAYFWVGKRGTAKPEPDPETGIAVPERTESNRLTRAYNNEDIIVTLSESLSVNDILWLSVWCIQFKQNFGHVIVPANVQVPRSVVVGQLSDATHGVRSGDITVVDSRTIVVDSFTCSCSQTGIKFVMTTRDVRLEHPDTPYVNLDSASKLDFNLTIPHPNTVYDFQLLALHSFRNDRTMTHIALPSTLLVPPYFGRAETTTDPAPGDAGVCISHNAVLTLLATSVTLIWWW